jgi:hypothetical protein
MNEYLSYKAWWLQHQAPHKVPSSYWGATPEEAFAQHVKDLGLYDLMETLANWPTDD